MERRPTTQDVSWFLDLRRTGQLNMDPPYQRKSAWSPRDRRFFLDTIFRGYPSPAIFLHKKISESGATAYDVVDGKQRLGTIFAFTENKIAVDKDFGDIELDGRKWKDLPTHLQRRIWDYVIPVEFLNMVESTVVNSVFERLNRNSRKLNPQEIRHARSDGWLINFVESDAERDDFWRIYKLSTTATSRRMLDTQFISELLIVVLTGAIAGFDQDVLDELYSTYDVPEETVADFDADAVGERFSTIKQYIRTMDAHNRCVQDHASTRVHLYSLWGWVALERQAVEPHEAAEQYATLMVAVATIAQERDLEKLVASQSGAGPLQKAAFRYAQNARGASTEPGPRMERHEVLRAVLAGQA
jgi:hypothetical protein